MSSVDNSRIVVCGDGDWIGDWIFLYGSSEKAAENNELVIGMVEWLAAGDELASLQVKGTGFKPLNKEKVKKRRFLTTLLMIGLAPMIVLLLGLLAWGLRQYELEQFEAQMRLRAGMGQVPPSSPVAVGSAVAAKDDQTKEPDA